MMIYIFKLISFLHFFVFQMYRSKKLDESGRGTLVFHKILAYIYIYMIGHACYVLIQVQHLPVFLKKYPDL